MGKKTGFSKISETLIRDVSRIKKNGRSPDEIIRLELTTEPGDPLIWLAAQRGTEKIYFSPRTEEDSSVAGIGCALRISPEDRESAEEVLRRLGKYTRGKIRLYGGIAFFKDEIPGNEWEFFKRLSFLIPRFEYSSDGKTGTFTLNLKVSEVEGEGYARIISDLDGVIFDPSDIPENPSGSRLLTYSPQKASWTGQVRRYIDRIGKGEIDKIVAARRLEVGNAPGVNPFRLVYDLRRTGDYAAHFLFCFDGESYFAGATPELLFKRDGDLVTTESLAGTMPRGMDSRGDSLLQEELLASEKEEREHDLVTNYIVNRLDPICELLAVSERVILKLSSLQHLYRKISGKLKKDIGDPDLLDALFPTPAVAGFPVAKSLDIIRENESFSRGWYAGAIGYTGEERSEYYVGIRSALITPKRIYIYSGAGIVNGSDPEKEWNEIELKTKKYKNILNYES